MKNHRAAAAIPLLSLLALGSSALAANVVQMSIAKAHPEADVYHPELSKDVSSKASIQEGLFNNVTGGSYMANVLVGTPPQNISVVIDTGSSDTFLLAVNADQCSDPSTADYYGPCVGGTYNPKSSSTYKLVDRDGFDIQYVDQSGSEGDYISDVFSIGGATVSALQMGLALRTTVGVGIMGIGYTAGESVTTREQYPNLIDQMVSQKLINLKAYSLWLNDKESTTGNVLFGGIDTEKYVGTLKMVPVQPDKESGLIRSFIVTLNTLTLTDQNGTTSNMAGKSSLSLPVILDSGTTITYLPSQVLDTIITAIGAVKDTSGSGFTFVDCDWRTTRASEFLSFGFGDSSGPTINVPLSEVIRSLRGTYDGISPFQNTCALGIRSSSGTFLLGDTFLRSAYVVYDLVHNQVALAQSNFESEKSNVQEIPAGASAIPLLSGQKQGVTQVPQSHFTTTGSADEAEKTSDGGSLTYTSLSMTGAGGATPTVTGGGGGGTTGTGVATGSTGTAKSAAVGTVPAAFERSGVVVVGLSVMFALMGGLWVLA